MSESSEPLYLTRIEVQDAFVIRGLTIEIGDDPSVPQHLILTGPNGSGKSSVLLGLFRSLTGPRPDNPGWLGPGSTPSPTVTAIGVTRGRCVAYLGTKRGLIPRKVDGPKALDLSRHATGASQNFVQYLINRRTEQAYAREDGDVHTADSIAQWFHDFEQGLREIFADPELALVQDRQHFDYHLRFAGDHDVEFDQLPDGFSSVLDIWAEILLQIERYAQQHGHTPASGFVLIDELELHLHAELQEKILPFLVRLFPQMQFIITTHSPAIASSIDGATVFDLRTRERIDSSELRGHRYGSIFTEWFGISTDFDLETTAELRRLESLARSKPATGTAEHAELTQLANRLAARSHLLGLQVRKQLEDEGHD